MQMGDGCGVVFFMDPKDPSEWFLMRDDANGMPGRLKLGTPELSGKAVRDKPFEVMGYSDPSGSMLVRGPIQRDGETMWALITSSLRFRTRKAKD
jgi:hypothetical protein